MTTETSKGRDRRPGPAGDRSERPRLSVSQISTLHGSFQEDLRVYADAGLDGIGVWEMKLPEGGDEAALDAFRASGLAAGSAVPQVPSLLPLPRLGGPVDPGERLDALCRSLHRLAPFAPSGVVCLTGTGLGRDPDDAREVVVAGLRALASEAAGLGLRVALEPYQRVDGAEWTIVSSIPEALALIADAGDPPALALQFDVWHLWNTPTLYEDIACHAGRFAGVHVSGYRSPTRGWADRALPGQGAADLPGILAALEAAGWAGLYDVELFSDDGTFGAAYPDSLWALPAPDLLARIQGAFARAWEASRVMVLS